VDNQVYSPFQCRMMGGNDVLQTFHVYLLLNVPLKNFSLTCRHHHCRWKTAKFRPMLSTHILWARRDLYHATPPVTQGLSFSSLIRRTAPFSHLLRHTRGCGRSILIHIHTGAFWNFFFFLDAEWFNLQHCNTSWHQL
jgi:hypothetical protein